LQAYAAEVDNTVGQVAAPIYSSDRVPSDVPAGTSAALVSPVVANGRVYVAGGFGVLAYGVIPPRTLPPAVDPPPPPNCEAGVSWENFSYPFMMRYCTHCHAEYNDLGFTRRRSDRVATALAPSDSRTIMPPVPDPNNPPPLPTDAERARMIAWLRCGAPTTVSRFHAGWSDVSAPMGAFLGDGYVVRPGQPGVLSGDRRADGMILNPFAPNVPDAVFAYDRTGPSTYLVPVPGEGHYAVSIYLAEMACAAAGPDCGAPLSVSLNDAPWVSNLDVFGRAGPRRAIVQSTAIDLPPSSQLRVDVTTAGRVQAIEVVRTEACTDASRCPTGFVCAASACVPGGDRADGGAGPDAGSYDGGFPSDAPYVTDTGGSTVDGSAAMDGGSGGPATSDAGSTQPRSNGCSCSAPGSRSTRTSLAVTALWLACVALLGRRRPRD
jgi:hypothetical protein